MRLIPPLLVCTLLFGTACTPSTPSSAQLQQQCVQALQASDQKRPDSQIEGFCSCFIEGALKKVSAQKIASQFKKGDDPEFQKALDPVLEQCNVAMVPSDAS